MTTERHPPEGLDFFIGDEKNQPNQFVIRGEKKITTGLLAAEPTAPPPDRFATAPQETLRPYDADAACPQCGAKSAFVRWWPGNTRLDRAYGSPSIVKTNAPIEPGWMQRTCTNCVYMWAEAPADAS
jgi:hypothetical protein